jgi:hypothetical protein
MNTHRTVSSGHVRHLTGSRIARGVLSASTGGRRGSAGHQVAEAESHEFVAAPPRVRLEECHRLSPSPALAEQEGWIDLLNFPFVRWLADDYTLCKRTDHLICIAVILVMLACFYLFLHRR